MASSYFDPPQMALNPPLLPGGLPAGIAGEFFCLERSGIELSVDTQSRELGKQVLAKCRLFMTTLRICVVCTTANSSGLQSFDIPMQGISGESFEQPWFGANYLKLAVAPVLGRGLSSPAQVKITFIEGGCGLFLRVFFALMARYKDADAAARAAFLAPPSMQAWVSQTQTAYVDREFAFPALALLLYAAAPRLPTTHMPFNTIFKKKKKKLAFSASDPSRLFITQPAVHPAGNVGPPPANVGPPQPEPSQLYFPPPSGGSGGYASVPTHETKNN